MKRERRSDTTLVGVVLFAFVGFLVVPAVDTSALIQGILLLGLGLPVVGGPVLLCWRAVNRVPHRRKPQLWFAAAAVTAFAAGQVCLFVVRAGLAFSVFEVLASVFFLSFYPLLMGALTVLVYRQEHRLSWTISLDSSMISLGAASVLVVVLSPILSVTLGGQPSLNALVSIATPMLDVISIATITGIAASKTIEIGPGWPFLVAGLLAFAGSDVVLALSGFTPVGSDGNGTLHGSGWTGGLILIALWVRSSALSDRTDRRGRGAWVLAVPIAAAAGGLAVLVIATQTTIPPIAVGFAAVAVVLASARTTLAFQELLRLGDLRRQALTDDLTGLPNRRALYANVPSRLAPGRREHSALLLLDLDRFKEVNDSMGHDLGDQLLRQIGLRLEAALRPLDLLARLGGDEFAILLDDADETDARTVATLLGEALARPYLLGGITLQTSASIGIALFPEHSEDLTGLLRKADMAMYKAKETRTGFRVYRGDDDSRGEARLRTLEELRLAVDAGQLLVHYQPKLDLADGGVRGVEAVLRWNHPERGLLGRDQFLALADAAGLTPRVTGVILGTALDQAVVWRAGGTPLSVAVSLPASALADAELPERTMAMIAARGLPASALILEFTEESLLHDRTRTRDLLARLRASGIGIAVDDFGTGLSSLAFLRELPIDELKLDRSFVAPLTGDSRAGALAASAIGVAHSLGLRMVAEGVGDGVALAELVRHGCDEAQGAHLCPPLPAAELNEWLAGQRMPVVPVP
jgi:diguanylate cyclase